jgi:translation initiation factor IF-3
VSAIIIYRAFLFYFEVININNNKPVQQINDDIRDKEIRVVGNDGSQLGIMSSRDALKLAAQQNLDLVKIAPMASPPVCKIMDYGKFLFEQQKKDKENKKNQKIVEIKEIRMSSGIDKHDFDTKVSQAIKFLQGGDKLKVSVKFIKRAIAHPELGVELLTKFGDAVKEYGNIEKKPKMEGRNCLMFVNPKKTDSK